MDTKKSVAVFALHELGRSLPYGDLALVRRFLPRPAPSEILIEHQGVGGFRTSSPFVGISAFFRLRLRIRSHSVFFRIFPLLILTNVSIFNKYKSTHLNVELLHLCDRLVDGVVVALVGDVVPSSRPCWLHITREGLLDWAATLVLLKSWTHSFVGLCLSHARNSP